MIVIPELGQYMDLYKSLDSAFESSNGDPLELLLSFPLAQSAFKTVPHVQIQFDELTAFCPWTKFPDQGSILIEYIPNNKLLELKSFKYYLLAFRDTHITQEHLAQKIHNDLMMELMPLSLKVVLDYMPRGGLHTVITLE